MTITITRDNLLEIGLPLLVAFLAVCITISTFFISVASHEQQVAELLRDNDELFQDLAQANSELNEFLIIEEKLQKLGASHVQSTVIIKASHLYNLDPILLGTLIASESSFHNRHHALPGVVGLCGINTTCGSELPYNPYTDYGNIMDAAKLLRDYKNTYKSDYLAVKRYKGWSNLGASQARNVIQRYRHVR